jgi:hypothetical protein
MSLDKITLFNTAVDFRTGLRFPRVTREPPRLCLRGLTLATSPAVVFVLHSNQQLGPPFTKLIKNECSCKSEISSSTPRKASACNGKERPGFALNLYIEGISQEL